MFSNKKRHSKRTNKVISTVVSIALALSVFGIVSIPSYADNLDATATTPSTTQSSQQASLQDTTTQPLTYSYDINTMTSGWGNAGGDAGGNPVGGNTGGSNPSPIPNPAALQGYVKGVKYVDDQIGTNTHQGAVRETDDDVAIYKIYTANGTDTGKQFVMPIYGESEVVQLDVGNYYCLESKAPYICNLNPEKIPFVITAQDTVTKPAKVICNDYRKKIELTAKKTSDKTRISNAAAGDEITWTVSVTNTGELPVRDVTVTDALIRKADGSIITIDNTGTLKPGETRSGSAVYKLTQNDIDKGYVVNSAIAHGKCETDRDVYSTVDSNTASATVSITKTPEITIRLSANKDKTVVGDSIEYAYEIENTGNIELRDVWLTNEKLGIEKYSVVLSLLPGQKVSINKDSLSNCVYNEVTNQEGLAQSVYNDVICGATVVDDYEYGLYEYTNITGYDDLSIPVDITPSLTLSTTASTTDFESPKNADEMTWTYVVTNTGVVKINNIQISDPLLEAYGIEINKELGADGATLMPEESFTLVIPYNIRQENIDAKDIINKSIASGTSDITGEAVKTSVVDTPLHFNWTGKLILNKTANKHQIDEGGQVIYSFEIINDTNTTLRNVLFSDDKLKISNRSAANTMLPGDVISFDEKYNAVMSDAALSVIHNVASVYATLPDNTSTLAQDSVNVTVEDNGLPKPPTPGTGTESGGNDPDEPMMRVIPDGIYMIGSALNKNMMIDIKNGSQKNGANVQVYSKNYSDAQKWSFKYDKETQSYTIRNLSSNKVIDIENGKIAQTTNIQQWSGNDTDAQRWYITKNNDNTYTFLSVKNMEYALDLSQGIAKNAANVHLWRSNDTKAQKWVLTPSTAVETGRTLPDGVYTIAASAARYQMVDVANGSKKNGGNVWLWTKNNTKAQKYSITYDHKGYYTIQNVNSGLVLDAKNAGTVNGTNVWQYKYNGSDAQKWAIAKHSDGTYTLINKKSGKVMDLLKGSTKNTTNIQLYSCNETAAQKWILRNA